jgi:hypothetical protein
VADAPVVIIALLVGWVLLGLLLALLVAGSVRVAEARRRWELSDDRPVDRRPTAQKRDELTLSA